MVTPALCYPMAPLVVVIWGLFCSSFDVASPLWYVRGTHFKGEQTILLYSVTLPFFLVALLSLWFPASVAVIAKFPLREDSLIISKLESHCCLRSSPKKGLRVAEAEAWFKAWIVPLPSFWALKELGKEESFEPFSGNCFPGPDFPNLNIKFGNTRY